jgi:predicted RNA-binding protein with PIN domain
MSDRLIIVDGYNLIHRTPVLRPGPDRSLEQARDKLLNLLAWAIGTGDARFIVVFDGATGVRDEESGSPRVEVRYSKPPDKADDVIRRLVEERVDRVDRLTVVTADLEVARHARAMGADIAISDLFLASAIGPGGAAAAADAEGADKPTTLSRKDLEEWAELFRRGKPAAGEGEADA